MENKSILGYALFALALTGVEKDETKEEKTEEAA